MFQRLKGAIDNRIAEEQARQRAAAAALSGPPNSRSGSVSARRPAAPRNVSPGRRAAKPRERRDVYGSSERSPDPSEFDTELGGGEDEVAAPDESAGPREENVDKSGEGEGATGNGESNTTAEEGESRPAGESEGGQVPVRTSEELPSEVVRVRLRKLDRLEGRYQDLLRAYRTAHARVQLIEPFEASLRENTPLTSINDPPALLEYLNQIKLKGDMVLDELKRVSSDRDEHKKKLEESEKTNTELKEEVAALKAERQREREEVASTIINGADKESGSRPPSLEVTTAGIADETKSDPATSVKTPSPTSSKVPSFSLFSPRSKPSKIALPPKDTPEEFFSYDTEIPRFQSQLQESQANVDELTKQVDTLKRDLAVARESTESMVQNLETATRELHGLRDAKDKSDAVKVELQGKINTLQDEVEQGTIRCSRLEKKMEGLQSEVRAKTNKIEEQDNLLEAAAQSEKETKTNLDESRRILDDVLEKLTMKEATVKDLEDSLAMAKSADRQEAQSEGVDSYSDKKIATLQGIMDELRLQLKEAESTVESLKSDLEVQHTEFKKRPSSKLLGFLDVENDPDVQGIENEKDAVEYLSRTLEAFNHREVSFPESTGLDTPTSAQQEIPPNGPGKKKNKKKRKGKGGAVSAAEPTVHDGPVKVTEDLAEADEDMPRSSQPTEPENVLLRTEIADLHAQLAEKDSSIDRLTSRLRDQETLKEEIETLRDDLLHQGEGHVEARDALRAAQAERTKLQESVTTLEKELADSKARATASSAESEAVRRDLVAFEELKSKVTVMRTDLAAAEQLAAARFKDITDLRDVLSKAQPELRSLRSEVEELKSVREDLKNKSGELRRLESRHEDLKSEMKNLGKKIGDQDIEVKNLQQRVAQEMASRSRAEQDLQVAQSDLRFSEARKQEAVESSSETSRELGVAKEEAAKLETRLHDLEEQVSKHTKEVSSVREELSLKTSLHNSSQSLIQGLRDQTHELSIQAREASARSESLEEELAEAQRMLSERSREGETMRRLLNDTETQTGARLREMKERMETVMEERDRAEDDVSMNGRRLAREIEDLKTKARDVGRALKATEEERDELQLERAEWKRRRDDLESLNEKWIAEVTEVRGAMARLREALDESERQGQESERQKLELRKAGEEAQQKAEKTSKVNKQLSEEIKTLQQLNSKKIHIRTAGGGGGGGGGGLDSGVQSSRSSFDSQSGGSIGRGAVRSPAPNIRDRMPSSRSETPTGPNTPLGIDYIYLKNVLLQFLEQKDKNHQKQLIPVLGMLLHFDRKDEQKWMSAITAAR